MTRGDSETEGAQSKVGAFFLFKVGAFFLKFGAFFSLFKVGVFFFKGCRVFF